MAETNIDLDQLKKLHAQYVFIHQCLTQKGQYFIDEFEIARDAIQTITKVANDLGAKLKELTPAEPESNEEAQND